MSDEPIKKEATQGFLSGLLGDIPGFVRGILATMFGTTLCFVAMLQLGGLQVPFTNWLTSQVTAPVKELNSNISELKAVIARIEAAEVRYSIIQDQQIRLEHKANNHSNEINRLKKRLGVD